MSDQNRRSFVKLAGGAIGLGTVLSSSGSVTAAPVQEDLPALRGPYAEEAWVEYRAGPGNATATADAPDLDPDAIEYASLYDGEYVSQGAIVGDTLYVTASGRVRALDAYDGSVQWSSDEFGVSGTPAAAYDRIIASGRNGPMVALDIEDGSLDWEIDLDGRTSIPTVAYETVYTVSDGSLYALDVTDGSIQWERRPEGESAAFQSVPAVSTRQVYATVDLDEGDDELVALDAASGDRQWTDPWEWHNMTLPAATEAHVTVADGLGDERFRVVDTADGEPVAGGSALTVPALDDEVAMTILDWELEATFFDGRDGWRIGNFSTSALGEPTIAGDTVFVYVGDDHREEYSYSLLAIDKYDGEVEWTVDVPASNEGLGISVVTTSDAIYVFEQDEIHIVQEADSGDEDDSTDGEDSSTPEETETPEDTGTPEETETPGETATPDDPDSDCGCPDETTTPDTPPGSRGEASPTDEESASTVPTTSTDEETTATPTSTSTAGDTAGDAATATGETDGAGPGLGVVSTLSSLGGVGYVLHRRLGGDSSEQDTRER